MVPGGGVVAGAAEDEFSRDAGGNSARGRGTCGDAGVGFLICHPELVEGSVLIR